MTPYVGIGVTRLQAVRKCRNQDSFYTFNMLLQKSFQTTILFLPSSISSLFKNSDIFVTFFLIAFVITKLYRVDLGASVPTDLREY